MQTWKSNFEETKQRYPFETQRIAAGRGNQRQVPVFGPRVPEQALQVLTPERGSLADRAGFKENDVLVSLDGAPVPDKETLNRLIAAKRWGDVAVYVVRRGTGTQTLTMLFRRTPATK